MPCRPGGVCKLVALSSVGRTQVLLPSLKAPGYISWSCATKVTSRPIGVRDREFTVHQALRLSGSVGFKLMTGKLSALGYLAVIIGELWPMIRCVATKSLPVAL